jgi:peptidoglycan/LPS O-acetylase OafA/YrhL
MMEVKAIKTEKHISAGKIEKTGMIEKTGKTGRNAIGTRYELLWIDVLKGLAAIAVVVDHAHGVLYQDALIEWMAFVAVPVYILLAGTTSAISCERHPGRPFFHEYLRRIRRTCESYAVAVLLYQILLIGKGGIRDYFDYLIHFDVIGPMYYLAVYLQLLLVAPLLYRIIRKIEPLPFRGLIHAGILALLYGISLFLMQFPLFLRLYGGGQFLFGGTFLVLFYLGMLLGTERDVFSDNPMPRSLFAFVSGTLCLWFLLFYHRRQSVSRIGFYHSVINPPGILLMVYALLFVLTFLLLYYLVRPGNVLWRLTGWLGRASLHIYLYHTLFLDLLVQYTDLEERPAGRAVCFLAALLLPALLYAAAVRIRGIMTAYRARRSAGTADASKTKQEK